MMFGIDLVDYLDDVMNVFFARLLSASLIFLLGYALAWVTKFCVRRLLQGLAKIIYRSLPTPGAEQAALRTRAIDLFANVVFWCLVAYFLATAAETIGMPLLHTWVNQLAGYLPRVLLAVAIVFFGVLAGSFLRDIISRGLTRSHMPHGRIIGQLTQAGIVAMAVIIAVGHIGIDLTLLVLVFSIVLGAALFGAALSFGLGAREMVANIIACYYVQKLYRVGDLVDIGGHRGIIVRITGTFVVLHAESGQIAIPAGDFAREVSSLPTRKETPAP